MLTSTIFESNPRDGCQIFISNISNLVVVSSARIVYTSTYNPLLLIRFESSSKIVVIEMNNDYNTPSKVNYFIYMHVIIIDSNGGKLKKIIVNFFVLFS